jgi:hypothetical protein
MPSRSSVSQKSSVTIVAALVYATMYSRKYFSCRGT